MLTKNTHILLRNFNIFIFLVLLICAPYSTIFSYENQCGRASVLEIKPSEEIKQPEDGGGKTAVLIIIIFCCLLLKKTSFQQCEPDMDGVTYRFHFFPRQRTIIGIFYQTLILAVSSCLISLAL